MASLLWCCPWWPSNWGKGHQWTCWGLWGCKWPDALGAWHDFKTYSAFSLPFPHPYCFHPQPQLCQGCWLPFGVWDENLRFCSLGFWLSLHSPGILACQGCFSLTAACQLIQGGCHPALLFRVSAAYSPLLTSHIQAPSPDHSVSWTPLNTISSVPAPAPSIRHLSEFKQPAPHRVHHHQSSLHTQPNYSKLQLWSHYEPPQFPKDYVIKCKGFLRPF